MQTLDAQQTSVIGTTSAKPVELKIPLWWADGATTTMSGVASAGSLFLQDGSGPSSTTNSGQHLYTFSAKWPSSTNVALEVTFATSGTSYTAYCALWDFTTSTIISGTQLSTTSNTQSVYRSGQVTVTPGHVYGVTLWSSSASGASEISDASLIVFPN